MTSTTKGTLATNACGRRSIEFTREIKRSRNGTRTALGAFAFRALARALAWLVLAAGTCLRVGVVRGPDRVGRLARASPRSVRLLVGVSRLLVMNHPSCQQLSCS